MTLKIVQIGDIHISTQKDHLFQKQRQLANCIVSECQTKTESLFFLLTGDYTQAGTAEEFLLATQFINSLVAEVAKRTGKTPTVASIPGNHDLDLGTEQRLRDKTIATLTDDDLNSPSIQSELIRPQANYFKFAREVQRGINFDWETCPFFNQVSITLSNRTVQFKLLNTAWMSVRHEAPGTLLFPTEVISTDQSSVNPYVITSLHHPLNWFKQPNTMRQLRDIIEARSDLIVTGHEHSNDRFGKVKSGISSVEYIEGGVLQERSDHSRSTFNIFELDFDADRFLLKRMSFQGEVYVSLDSDDHEPIPENRAHQKTACSPTTDFLNFLRSTDLPIATAKGELLTHEDIFTYPDLRERSDSDPDKQWLRVKGRLVSKELREGQNSLIASDAMGGKTSLLKQLCLDAISENCVAVFLACNESSKVDDPSAIMKWIKAIVENQYGKDFFDKIKQNRELRTFVAIDNLHHLKRNRNQAAMLVEAAVSVFDNICVTSDIDFFMEESRMAGPGTASIGALRKMQICEFGFVKIEDLARRWITIKNPAGADDESIRKICKTIETVLRINAMPHHPWVLIVLLQEATSKTELAAKNGSYGYLYQAVVTGSISFFGQLI